ncbi:hypothetical protein D3C80_2145050 [compost metagenome]
MVETKVAVMAAPRAKKDPPKRVSFHYLGNQASSSKHSATMAMPLSSCASGMVTGIRKRMTL